MSGEELFSGINLGNSLDEIEIPEVVEAGSGDTTTAKQEKSKSVKPDPIEDEGLIEIPDVIEEDDTEKVIDDDNPDEKEPSDSKVKSGTSSPSPFEPFAKALYEEGIFSHFDVEEFAKMSEELGEVDALFELTRRNIDAEIAAYKDAADADYKAFVEARDRGIDLNEYAKLSKNVKKYGSIEESSLEDDEALQKTLVQDYLRNRGFSQEEIDDTVESYEDTAKMYNKSKIALKNLIKSEEDKFKKLEEDAKNKDLQIKEQVKKQKEELQNLIGTTEQIIPDVKLTKNEKNKLFELITAPVAKDAEGNLVNAIMKKRLENPLKYAMLEAYYHSIGLYDEKFDKLTKKAKSDSIKKLTEVLSTEGFKTGKPARASASLDPDYEDAWKRL
jgi:hypothetical protein